jgi:rubredoxin
LPALLEVGIRAGRLPVVTTLNIGQVVPDRQVSDMPRAGNKCPACGAGKEKRIDGGGFGRTKLTLCGYCGYEFKAEEL